MSRKKIVVVAVLLAVVVLGGVGAVGLWQYHEQPEFCATCHIMDPYLKSWQASDYGVHAHAEHDVACLDCHEPTIQQQMNELMIYVQGDYEVPLKPLKYPSEECLECHEHGSYDEVVAMTAHLDEEVGANPHDSHYGEMECRLCHKMHQESEDYCAQ
jgi:nitrate/TMAO reductase-like tetraheme cytochrome c subunit